MRGTRKYSISDLAELFSISRTMFYRTIARPVEPIIRKPRESRRAESARVRPARAA